jgi:hypothetical protein
MGRKQISIAFFSVLLLSTLPLTLPNASASTETPSTGISDCYYERSTGGSPSSSNSTGSFHWSFASDSVLTDEFNNSGHSSGSSFHRVFIREVNGLFNISQFAISYSSWSVTPPSAITSKSVSGVVTPTEQTPIIEYDIALVNYQYDSDVEEWSWVKHPVSCIVTLDYDSGDWKVETVSVDFTLTYTAADYENDAVIAPSVSFAYDSDPISESDVWGYYVMTHQTLRPNGLRTGQQNYWSDFQYQNSTSAVYINWENGTSSGGWSQNSVYYSFIDESESSAVSMQGIQGIYTAELVAFDRYGNTAVVATESVEVSKPVPIFETCSIEYNRDANLLEVNWDISPYSASYVSGAYHVSISESIQYDSNLRQWGNTYDRERPFSHWSDFAQMEYPLNDDALSFMDTSSSYWIHNTHYNFPLSIVHTSSDEIISQCSLEIVPDLMLDPVPQIESVEFSVDETVTVLWNVSNYHDWDYVESTMLTRDVDYWQLCWSDQFFLDTQFDETTCLEISTEFADDYSGYLGWDMPQTGWGNLTALISSDSFCKPDCPAAVYATLIPFDQYGNNATFGTLGVFTLVDTDGDGVPDGGDVFPNDANETTDSDGDGVGDNGDVFPNDPDETEDTDEDGVGDNGDSFPNDANETTDSDGDGVGDNGDVFPSESSQWADDDGDGLGDNTSGVDGDPFLDDFDNDGVIDAEDAFPTNANETLDSDGDGIGDEEDEDDDGDGILDKAEIREGSDPKDPNSLPPESFELTLPILGVSLSAWDLMGVLSGLCLLGYIGAATLTREKRYEDYMEQIESTTSPTELDDISKRLEQLQLFRLLGVRHVLRLEQRIMDIQGTMVMMNEATLDDIPNPPSDSGRPPLDASGIINDGHEWVEWPENSGSQWYRPEGTHSDWTKL